MLAGASVTTAADLADRVGGSLTDAKNLSGKLGTALTDRRARRRVPHRVAADALVGDQAHPRARHAEGDRLARRQSCARSPASRSPRARSAACSALVLGIGGAALVAAVGADARGDGRRAAAARRARRPGRRRRSRLRPGHRRPRAPSDLRSRRRSTSAWSRSPSASRCSAAWSPAPPAACAPPGCAPPTPSATSTDRSMDMTSIAPALRPARRREGLRQRRDAGAAVDGVDLEVRHGEFLVVAGPSGSGKTTLLQLLGALDRPDGGRVEFEGQDLDGDGRRRARRAAARHVGFIFQQFNLIPTLTAAQNVEAALAPRRFTAAERRARAASCSSGSGSATAGAPAVAALRRRAAARRDRPGAGQRPAACCSPTSRPATSTRRPARTSSACSAALGDEGLSRRADHPRPVDRGRRAGPRRADARRARCHPQGGGRRRDADPRRRRRAGAALVARARARARAATTVDARRRTAARRSTGSRARAVDAVVLDVAMPQRRRARGRAGGCARRATARRC